MRGLYVHIPFCVRKCAYCDFYSLPVRNESVSDYVEAVFREASAYSGMSFRTLYLGGGTPSLLGADNLRTLLLGLRRIFALSTLTEATIEINPDSGTGDLLNTARSLGINRISIGVQSLSDYELKSAGRVHNPAQAIQAIRCVKAFGFDSISCDVIIGLPGQSWQTLKTTLDTLTSLGVQHISAYCLSLEKGTPLSLNPPSDLPSDDEQAELFNRATGFLKAGGFIHYEISNFAVEGHQCRHNLNYWRGGEYLGLGPAAASHLDGRRFKNRANLNAFLENPAGLTEDVEELGKEEKSAEEAMLRLRLLAEGLDVNELAQRFGFTDHVIAKLDNLAAEGLLHHEGSVYRLPSNLVLTSNPILARVLGD